MYIILRWLLNTLVLLLVSFIVPGVEFSSLWSALVTSVIFGLINALIRPILILLTLPINILSLGLFTLVINTLMFWLASNIVKGFEIQNFAAAFWGALVYWLIVTCINYLEKPAKA